MPRRPSRRELCSAMMGCRALCALLLAFALDAARAQDDGSLSADEPAGPVARQCDTGLGTDGELCPAVPVPPATACPFGCEKPLPSKKDDTTIWIVCFLAGLGVIGVFGFFTLKASQNTKEVMTKSDDHHDAELSSNERVSASQVPATQSASHAPKRSLTSFSVCSGTSRRFRSTTERPIRSSRRRSQRTKASTDTIQYLCSTHYSAGALASLWAEGQCLASPRCPPLLLSKGH